MNWTAASTARPHPHPLVDQAGGVGRAGAGPAAARLDVRVAAVGGSEAVVASVPHAPADEAIEERRVEHVYGGAITTALWE
jgi:hypothetical protein